MVSGSVKYICAFVPLSPSQVTMWPQLEQTRSACLSPQLKVGDEIQDNRDPKSRIPARMCYAAAIGGNGTGVGAKVTSLTFQERLRVHHYILTDESRKGMIHDLVPSDRKSSVSPAPRLSFPYCTLHIREDWEGAEGSTGNESVEISSPFD